jgi:hypothetical protein
MFPREQRCTKARRRPNSVKNLHRRSGLITQSSAVCAQTCENCIKTAYLCQSEYVMGSITNSCGILVIFYEFFMPRLASRAYTALGRLGKNAEAHLGKRYIDDSARAVPTWRSNPMQRVAAASPVCGRRSDRRPGEAPNNNRRFSYSFNAARVPAARSYVGEAKPYHP